MQAALSSDKSTTIPTDCTDCTDKASTITALQNQLQELQQQKDDLENALLASASRVVELEEKSSAETEQREKEQREREQRENVLATIENSLAAALAEKSALQDDLTVAVLERQQLSSQIVTFSDDAISFKAKYEVASEECKVAIDELKSLAEKLQVLSALNASLELAARDSAAALLCVRVEIQEVKGLKEALDAKLDEATNSLEAQRTEIQALTNKLETHEKVTHSPTDSLTHSLTHSLTLWNPMKRKHS